MHRQVGMRDTPSGIAVACKIFRWDPLAPLSLSSLPFPSLPQEPEFRVPRNIRVYRETCYTYISRPFYPYFRSFLDGLWIFVRSNRFFFYILIIF